jgi:hypothetical protein
VEDFYSLLEADLARAIFRANPGPENVIWENCVSAVQQYTLRQARSVLARLSELNLLVENVDDRYDPHLHSDDPDLQLRRRG